MARYTHENLSVLEKAKARWRSMELAFKRINDLVEQDGMSVMDAANLAQREINELVDQRRAEA